MMEDWCCDMLESLKIRENHVKTLQEIRVRLHESSNLEAAVTNRLLSAPEIFECVEDFADGSNSSERLDLASDILSICMSNLSLVQNDFSVLKRSIIHTNPKIRSLALYTILRELEKHYDESGDVDDDFLKHVLNAIQDEETSVGLPAVGILSILLHHNLDKTFVKDSLLRALQKNAIVRCRVYEVSVNLAKRSSETMGLVEYLLDYALAELNNDDVMLQVNVMEILVSLAEQNHGFSFLEQRHVFEVISRRVEARNENKLDWLLVPGIMKFFGKIATLHPQKIIVGYPHMIKSLFECIISGDHSILPAAFDTMANLIQTQEGKKLLEAQYREELQEIFEQFASYLSKLTSDLKIRLFKTLAIIFTVDGKGSQEITDILQKWFRYLSGDTNMQFLMEFCRNPFPDIKVSCLSFIKSLCHYFWGIVALKDTAGLLEHLLDRKVEYNHDTRYAKYEVIKLLAESTVFDMQTQLQLKSYVNDGPYFVQSSMEIAFEDTNGLLLALDRPYNSLNSLKVQNNQKQ